MLYGTNPNAEILLGVRGAGRRKKKERTAVVILNVGVIAVVVAAIGANVLIQAAEAVAMHPEKNVSHEQRPVIVAAASHVNRKAQVQAGGNGVGLRDDEQVTPLEECGLGFQARRPGVSGNSGGQRVHQVAQKCDVIDIGSDIHVLAKVKRLIETDEIVAGDSLQAADSAVGEMIERGAGEDIVVESE